MKTAEKNYPDFSSDFTNFYENSNFPSCENDSDKMDEMTIEDFKWNNISKTFDAGAKIGYDKAVSENKIKLDKHDEIVRAISELIDFAKNTVNHSDYINNYDDSTKKEDMKIIENAEQLLKKA